MLTSFLQEVVGVTSGFAIVLRTYNISLEQSVHSTNSLSDKRTEMDVSIVREMLEKGEVKEVEWVPTEQQLADCLAKKGASSKKLLQALSGHWKM